MDGEFVKWFATLGVGGVLAGLMFVFYRKDVKLYTDQWRGQSDQLMNVVKDNTEAITALRYELMGRQPGGRRWTDKLDEKGD